MARNRKRSRDRRARRPDSASALATARERVEAEPEADALPTAVPEPLAHATQPDDSPLDRSGEAGSRAVDSGEAELAEAQLALGRPELADAPDAEELEAIEQADEDGAGLPARRSSTAPGAPRESIGARLVNFLQGSWRELQRVQWPDRRQVFQATGVVIGFVIVAGVFLGLSDLVSQKIVNFILK